MPRKNKKKYSFPILKESEILKCMKELGIIMDYKDLSDPNEERYKIIYSNILLQLSGIDLTQDIKLYGNNMCNISSYPELHEKSIGQIALVTSLIKLMQRVGVKDFCMTDLISPDSVRTQRNLSAIINFAKFKADKWDMFEKIKKEEMNLQKLFENESNKNVNLAMDYQNLQNKIEYEKKDINKLKCEINELDSELTNYSNEYNIHLNKLNECKKKIQSNKSKIATKKIELNKLRDEIQDNEMLIVKSPQKMRNKIELMKKDIENRHNEIYILQNENREIFKKIGLLNELKMQLSKDFLNEMLLIEKNLNEIELNKKNRSIFDNKINNCKQNLRHLINNNEIIINNLNEKKNNYSILERESSIVLMRCNETENKAKNKFSFAKENNVKTENEINKINEKINAIKNEYKTFNDKYDNINKSANNQIDKLNKLLKNYHLIVKSNINQLSNHNDNHDFNQSII